MAGNTSFSVSFPLCWLPHTFLSWTGSMRGLQLSFEGISWLWQLQHIGVSNRNQPSSSQHCLSRSPHRDTPATNLASVAFLGLEGDSIIPFLYPEPQGQCGHFLLLAVAGTPIPSFSYICTSFLLLLVSFTAEVLQFLFRLEVQVGAPPISFSIRLFFKLCISVSTGLNSIRLSGASFLLKLDILFLFFQCYFSFFFFLFELRMLLFIMYLPKNNE